MNLKKLFLFCSLVFTTMAFAQQIVIGSVKDSKGKPVAGASVLVVGTSRTATTSAEGAYSIEAVAEETLQFSAQGYQNVQRKVGLETTIDVVLALVSEDAKTVGALGIERDANAKGYSDTTLEGGDDLKGKTAGLAAAGSGMGQTKMTLRGTSSVAGSSQPLVVIDGVPMAEMGEKYGNAASEINQDDIESVTVLTGGAATALYGSRGANGVILYTTKSGKGGKTSIDFNSYVTFERPDIAPKLQNEYGGGFKPTWNKDTISGTIYRVARYAEDENYGPKLDGTMYLPWYAFDQKYLPQHYLKYVPWEKSKNDVTTFFQTGITTNNSISITRSLSGTNLRFSLANSETTGIVPTTEMDKTNMSFSFTSELSSKLKVEGGLNYSITTRFNPQYSYTQNELARILYGNTQVQLDYKKLKEYYMDPDGKQRTWNRSSSLNPYPRFTDNPYWIINKITNNDKNHRFFGNIGFTYNFTNQLYLIGKIYGDVYSLMTEERRAVGSTGESNYKKYNSYNSGFNYEARLHYNPDFGETLKDILTLNTFIGTARSENRYEIAGGNTNGGLVVPNFYSIANSRQKSTAYSQSTWKRTNSVYGMASLGYKGTAFIELTGRNDWFSTVSKPIFYPSATFSYVFTNSFKNLPSWFTYGKVRAGWAQVGSDADPYVLKNYPVVNQPLHGVPNYAINDEINNPNLLPELKETWEAGLDLQFFDSRLTLGLSLYDALSKDLIISMPVDPANGYTTKKVNTGEMSNKGFEITLSATPIQTEKFGWYIDWNFSRNVNKLLKLAPGISRYKVSWDAFGNVNLYAIEGRPFGEIYGQGYKYDDKGNRLVDQEGTYLRSEEKLLGNINPDFTTGLTNTFTYGNFSLSFTFDHQHGGKYFSGSYMLGMNAGSLRESVSNGSREPDPNGPEGLGQRGVLLPGVFAQGTPKAGQPNDKWISAKKYGTSFYQQIAEQGVFDASYIKLRSLSLSYSVPLPETKHIKGLNFTLSGYNLWTGGLDWDGMDPETAAYNYGIGESSLPTTKSYTLSVGIQL